MSRVRKRWWGIRAKGNHEEPPHQSQQLLANPLCRMLICEDPRSLRWGKAGLDRSHKQQKECQEGAKARVLFSHVLIFPLRICLLLKLLGVFENMEKPLVIRPEKVLPCLLLTTLLKLIPHLIYCFHTQILPHYEEQRYACNFLLSQQGPTQKTTLRFNNYSATFCARILDSL